MRYFDWFVVGAVAVIVTGIIRFIVFGGDCNLMVVGMTFLVIFAVILGAMFLFRKLKRP